MKTLLLISPLASHSLMGGDFFFRMPCLGLLKVAALTPSDWQVKIVDEKVEPLDLNQKADLVGITAVTPTAPRGYKIADHFRQKGIPVVMGGMHVSQLPEEALKHCSSVIIGEAEDLWPKVLNDFSNGRLGQIYQHAEGPPSLVGQPQPDWSLFEKKNYLPVHFVETTRGCPLDCEFCAVTNAFGGRYRSRSLEDVLQELRSLKTFDGLLTLKRCVFFTDDNIIANRAYARQFLEQIADLKLKWFGQASINIANDDEILRLCQKSGCMGIFIGLETLSQETINSIGKKVNSPNKYLDVIQKLHDFGIGVDASFVFGFDTDDAGVFDRTLEFVIKAKVDAAYFSILTPYPGTRLYTRLELEKRLLTNDWSLYDGSHVVFKPKNLTPEQLLDGYFRSLHEVYSVPSIFKRLWNNGSLKQFFYPMNFGFKSSVEKMWRSYCKGYFTLKN